MKRSALAAILMLAVVGAAAAQASSVDDVRRLIATDAQFSSYRSESKNLLAPFESLEAHGLPPALLTGLLLEGASKHVAAPLLIEALSSEAQRLIAAQAMLSARPAGNGAGASGAEGSEALRRLSLALQGGVPVEVARSIMQHARAVDQGLVLNESLIAILRVGPLDDSELLALADSVLSSRLTSESYRSLPGLFVRARLRGLSMPKIVKLIERLLDRGYGLIQIEAEIQRQARTP